MKFSESWLREFVNPDCSGAVLSNLLTMAGLEVEEESTVAPPFEQVVIGEVLEVNKHPDADRLNVCRVNIGNGNISQIVCGAPNVGLGIKVPCALPGATLPGNITIKITKVRGVESSGMLCSARELGISEDASGLYLLPNDAPVGQDIRQYLDLDDSLRLLKLTPNRADCLSIHGIAREVAALTGASLNFPIIRPVPSLIPDRRDIRLEAPEACSSYCGRLIRGVNARASSPAWMRQRLERSGLRSISALVDITNYIMLELGQPLHAFDDAKLEGDIRVRLAYAGEKIKLLNEQTLDLQADVLVITDDKKTLAVAGIMGGEETGITLDTRDLFLESAFFTPKAIAGRARRYGFVSDASHRFERGVDFNNTRQVMERATALVLDICGGEPGPLVETSAELPVRPPVLLRPARVSKVLGVNFSCQKIEEFFTRLNFSFEKKDANFIVSPPSYRFDIEIEEDLIEEIARLYGYDNLSSVAPRGTLSMLSQTENERPLHKIRKKLADNGFQEVINYAFVEESWEVDLAANKAPIRLANPIASTMSVMRSSLLGGLLANVVTNLKRKQNRIRLFETGRCFFRSEQGVPVDGFDQPWKIAALAYGSALPEQWGSPTRQADFFDIKGNLEQLLAPTALRFEKTMHPALHPGRSAQVLIDGKRIGIVGELHPQWQQKYDLPLPPVFFELDLDSVKNAACPQHEESSRQPPAIRDLAIVLDQSVEVQEVMEAIRSQAIALIKDVRLFDLYTGSGIANGQKSLAFRIVMQDTQRTLHDAEIDLILQKLLVSLHKDFGAQRRA